MAVSNLHDANRRLLELQQHMGGGARTKEEPKPIYKGLEEAAELPPIPSRDAAELYELFTLTQLTTEGMTPTQAEQYRALLQRVRSWRRSEQSFLLCSQTKGVGKTHIARAVHDSFGVVQTNPNHGIAVFDRRGKFVTAREVMAILGEKVSANSDEVMTASRWVKRDWPILILDDVGREGNLRYVAAADQQREVRARYYDLINHCYTRNVRLFITSNYTVGQLAAGQGPFDEATFSRLLEMCGKGHMIDLQGFSDYRKVLGGF